MFKMTRCSSSNSYGMNELNKVNNFKYDGKVFYFGSIRSSRVESIDARTHNELIVKTKNTIYTLL